MLESDNNIVDNISNSFWKTFDLLRNDSIPTEEYHVVLFLLTLYEFDYFNDQLIYNSDNPKIQLKKKIIERDEYAEDGEFKEIFPIFEKTLNKISDDRFIQIYKIFCSFDAESLDKYFDQVFDSLLYNIASSQGKHGGQSIQPFEISKLVTSIFPRSGKDIYNPFAGFASYGVFRDKETFYYGDEKNQIAWAIGKLRTIAHDRFVFSIWECNDCVENWNSRNLKYDLIISTPPFNARLQQTYNSKFGKIQTYEQLLFEKGLNDLNAEGKIIAVLPTGFLFRDGVDKKIREYLIENDLLEMVISLPSGLFYNTGIPAVIVVVNKSKLEKESVWLVEGSQFCSSTSFKENKLEWEKLISILFNPENENVQLVPTDKIIYNDYNLNVSRYFHVDFPGEELTSFCNVVPGIKTKQYSQHQITTNNSDDIEKGRVVKVSHLKNDPIDFHLDDEKIYYSELNRPLAKIEQSCLLVSTVFNSLKPTYFTYSGKPIFLPNEIVALEPDLSKIEIGYLVNSLLDVDVQIQLELFSVGGTMPRMRKNDLLKIKIIVPDIKEQKAMMKGLLTSYKKIKEVEFERNALTFGFRKEQFDEFASLKHALGTPRQNILSYSEALISFFEENPAKSVKETKDLFQDTFGINLLEAFRSIRNDITYISELLEKGESGLNLNQYTLDIISIKAFEDEIKSFNNFSKKFILKIEPVKAEEKINQGILCNLTLLKVLVDNLLSNAEKYGFDSYSKENEVLIDLRIIEKMLVLDIKNNGNPFPKGYNKEKFITKFSTSDSSKGKGIGGYDINRIIYYFNGEWELILNEDKIYPVWYKILLPITHKN